VRIATFDHFDIVMSRDDAHAAHHQGRCDDDVAALAAEKYIAAQLEVIGADAIRAELRRWGAWDDAELADDEQNRQRIVWLAAGNITEEK
jgi:hypothetical protein